MEARLSGLVYLQNREGIFISWRVLKLCKGPNICEACSSSHTGLCQTLILHLSCLILSGGLCFFTMGKALGTRTLPELGPHLAIALYRPLL